MHNEENSLDEKYESRKDGYDDIVLRDAVMPFLLAFSATSAACFECPALRGDIQWIPDEWVAYGPIVCIVIQYLGRTAVETVVVAILP